MITAAQGCSGRITPASSLILATQIRHGCRLIPTACSDHSSDHPDPSPEAVTRGRYPRPLFEAVIGSGDPMPWSGAPIRNRCCPKPLTEATDRSHDPKQGPKTNREGRRWTALDSPGSVFPPRNPAPENPWKVLPGSLVTVSKTTPVENHSRREPLSRTTRPPDWSPRLVPQIGPPAWSPGRTRNPLFRVPPSHPSSTWAQTGPVGR